ncbi:MAG: hypothetical protein CBC89_06420 [Euryarchaeota archaeon TMED129]|nr:MAG: hypothetical protein CBC89_06420 [Euryarchaeota archaeon TMED129]
MAVFGKIDAATFANNVAVTNGDATVTKNAADTVVVGDILELSNVAYIVKEVTSTTAIELHKVYAGSTATALAGAVRRTAPKAVAEYVIKGGDSNSYDLVFVDTTEMALAENKSRGITGPGWWQYRTFTTANGDTKHKAECIAFVHATAGVAGDDADDTVVADVASAVTVTAQPAASTSSSGAGTFTLSTSTTGTPGALAYVWQRQTAASTKKWTNITASLDTGITYADFTTATLAYSGLASDALDGYKYRVKITSAGGTEEVITDGVGALTFGS